MNTFSSRTDIKAYGVLIVADLQKNNLRVMPNKQRYHPNAKYPRLVECASKHLQDYIFSTCSSTTGAIRKGLNHLESWIQCSQCIKWRVCTRDDELKHQKNKKWTCRDNQPTINEAKNTFMCPDDPCQVPDDYDGLSTVSPEVVVIASPPRQDPKNNSASSSHPNRTSIKTRSDFTNLEISSADLSFTHDIAHLLGEGRFAKVYSGQWKGENVAIKIFKETIQDEQFKRSFRQEQRAAFSLFNRVPNVVCYKGFCVEKKAIIMELVEKAMTLRQYFELRKPMGDRLAILLQIAEAMKGVHGTAKIIHKDLKPENVLISGTGHVKVADFGICHSLANSDTQSAGSGNSFFSPRYSSPEQETAADLTPKVDVWAFGFMVVEFCACGENEGNMSLWQDDVDPVRMSQKKKKYCSDFLSAPKSGDTHLIAMLPCAKEFLADSQKGMLKMVELVRSALHPTPEERPGFDTCIDLLKSALKHLDFKQKHGTTIVYHTLEPGDMWKVKSGSLTRRCQDTAEIEKGLANHVRNGSRSFFGSPYLSCSLNFNFCVHYCQVQMAHHDPGFSGVILEIDVTKLPPGIKILDLSHPSLAEEYFAKKAPGSTNKAPPAVNYATCSEEVVLDMGKELEKNLTAYDQKIPEDAILNVYDIPTAQSTNGGEFAGALHTLSTKAKKSFADWNEVVRKDRTHHLNKPVFWDRLKESSLVKVDALKSVREKALTNVEEYWAKDPSVGQAGRERRSGGGGGAAGAGKKKRVEGGERKDMGNGGGGSRAGEDGGTGSKRQAASTLDGTSARHKKAATKDECAGSKRKVASRVESEQAKSATVEQKEKSTSTSVTNKRRRISIDSAEEDTVAVSKVSLPQISQSEDMSLKSSGGKELYGGKRGTAVEEQEEEEGKEQGNPARQFSSEAGGRGGSGGGSGRDSGSVGAGMGEGGVGKARGGRVSKDTATKEDCPLLEKEKESKPASSGGKGPMVRPPGWQPVISSSDSSSASSEEADSVVPSPSKGMYTPILPSSARSSICVGTPTSG